MGNGVIAAARRYEVVCVVGLTSYSSTNSNASAANACGDSATQTYYHDGGGTYPVNGDNVYTDANGCNALNGGGNWYSDAGFGTAYQISSVGVVSNSELCI